MPGIFQAFMNFIQTAFTSFTDNFNRSTSGSLGTSSSGGLWNAESGTWSANGQAAVTATAASSYPIADITMSSQSTTTSITVGSPIIISATGTISTVTATTAGYTVVITALTTTTGLSAGQWISATAGTGSLGTPTDIQIVSVDSASQITVEVQGTAPTTGTITNLTTHNNDGGAGIALWVTNAGNWWGVTYGRSTNTSCNCSTCATYTCNVYAANYTSYTPYSAVYSGPSCTAGYSGGSYSCSAFAAYTPSYCSTYGGGGCAVWSGSYCVVPGGYSCTSFINGATTYACNTYTQSAYSCNGFGYSGPTYSAGTTTFSGPTYSCSSATYGYVSCNCQTCYPGYVRLIQSSSSVVSEITRWTLSQLSAAFKVLVNATTSVITIRPYTTSALVTQIGSDLTYTATGATKTNKFGIVLGPSDYIQGTTLDDFNIQSN